MVTGRLLGDAVVRRLGPAQVVRLGGGLAAFGLALGLSVQNATWSVAGFALVGLGLANIVPVVFSAAGRRAGPPGVALAATMGYGGLMGAPPVIGFLADALGLRPALGLLILAMAAVMLLAPAAAYRPLTVAEQA
jgi:MFS family permease